MLKMQGVGILGKVAFTPRFSDGPAYTDGTVGLCLAGIIVHRFDESPF
jgi:hypothetical protein